MSIWTTAERIINCLLIELINVLMKLLQNWSNYCLGSQMLIYSYFTDTNELTEKFSLEIKFSMLLTKRKLETLHIINIKTKPPKNHFWRLDLSRRKWTHSKFRNLIFCVDHTCFDENIAKLHIRAILLLFCQPDANCWNFIIFNEMNHTIFQK